MFKSQVVIFISLLALISCSGSSNNKKNSKKPNRVGESITSSSSRLAQAISGKIYCEQDPEYNEDAGQVLAQRLVFYSNGSMELEVYDDSDNFLGEFEGLWGASETTMTIRLTINGDTQELTGGAKVDTNGDLLVFDDEDITRYSECGATSVDTGTNDDTVDEPQTSDDTTQNDDDGDIVTPTIPSYDLTLLEIIKGNLFCEVDNSSRQIYFANDGRYTEADVTLSGEADLILQGKWSLAGNIVTVKDQINETSLVIQYTRAGILKVSKNTVNYEYEVCY